MDPTLEIKARLPIEELVGQYCQLKKKGRGFVCVCPFHQDTHPSMQVSPDKGIAYCFACSSGGDIFSFYQKIEGVDFKQALKDLGERTGVKVEGLKMDAPVQKDHKERLKECIQAAQKFYVEQLKGSAKAIEYVKARNVSAEQAKLFGIGFAPDSFSDTYQHLLKAGFSKKEIVDASLGIQKDLNEQKMYDRFRNRLMFPICDGSGTIIAFGGRTMGDDDAKYINSGETALYNKSIALYGLHLAKEAIRKEKNVVLVEGYFDVLACHRVGIENVVAVSGTALTEQHVKVLKRYAERVILCLDQDRAGKDAAERAFLLCSEEELPVNVVTLTEKDPDEAVQADPGAFASTIRSGGVPYIDHIIEGLQQGDVVSSDGKHNALKVLVPLIHAIQSSVERGHFLQKAAALLSTTEIALREDIEHFASTPALKHMPEEKSQQKAIGFSASEIALGIMFQSPQLRSYLPEMIQPDDPFASELYQALKEAPDVQELTVDMLALPEVHAERASILLLYCEHHSFTEWSESLAVRELRKNMANANRDIVKRKQLSIAMKLQKAREEGNTEEEGRLSDQYNKVLKLAKLSLQ